MINKIFIDVDTDRAKPIIFGKPPELDQPQNAEEASNMILNDIACLAEATLLLISIAHINGYAKGEELVEAAIKTLNQFTENKTDMENINDDGPKEETEGSTTEEKA